MAGITTHVLDTARGCPAIGVDVRLDRKEDGVWMPAGQGQTDSDGRLRTLVPEGDRVTSGIYRITFGTGAYQSTHGERGFFPEVSIVFEVVDATQHHHVPLLLSPFGYSTYRGS